MQNLIVSGGPYHSFSDTSVALARCLEDVGIDSTVVDELDVDRFARHDLVTINTLRWRMLGADFDDLRDEFGMSVPDGARAAFWAYLRNGGAILAMHTAAVCFDDWPEWRAIIGGRWDWERPSVHSPQQRSRVTMSGVDHAIVAGLPDFEVDDEVYSFLDREPDVVPLATSRWEGVDQPMTWARSVGAGRVFYDALGHDEASLLEPTHRRLIQRAALWATGSPDEEVRRV